MLTNDERRILAKNLVGCFKVYGRDLSHDSAAFMVGALEEFTLENTLQALKKYAVSDKTGRPPTVGALVEIMNPTASNETVANDAASRIFQAISKFGWTNPDGAREFVGELGWAVVRRFGGWQYVCENHGNELNVTTFHAQARELAKSQMELARLGLSETPPALPNAERKTLTSASGKTFDLGNLLELKTMPK
jgi:hypothetical protein